MSSPRSIAPVLAPLDARVHVPGSKSITNRALVCALLADGSSALRGVAPGDDSVAMVEAVEQLGGAVRRHGEDSLVVDGVAGVLRPLRVVLDAGLAGTTSRFLTAVAALSSQPLTIDGEAPLRRRPMAPLHQALGALGARVHADPPGHLPVTVTGPAHGGRVSLPGDVSSQYITALMLVAPLLPGGLHLSLTSPLVSRPYVTMTAAVMAAFGVDGVEVGDTDISVPSGRYRGTDYAIEPDASSASYPLAAAAITRGRVLVQGLHRPSLQGDAVMLDLLADMGARIVDTDEGVWCDARGVTLRGLGTVDMRDASDLVPTIAVVAAYADAPTRIDGVGFIRAKESDRLGDLARELATLGITATPHDEGLVVEPPGITGGHPVGGTVATHHDHRLAMALALVGLSTPGVSIEDPEVVSKSWPGYFEAFDDWSSPTR